MKKKLLLLCPLVIMLVTVQAQVYDTGGNVGIATTSPTELLQLGVAPNANHKLAIPGVYNFETIKLGQYGNGSGGLEFVNHSGVNASYGIRMYVNTDAVPGLHFQYAPAKTDYNSLSYTTGMFMDVSGNVGIGTVYPNRKLTVIGDASFSSVAYFDRVGANIRLKSDGTDARDAGLYADASGSIYLTDWNNSRGLKIDQNGNSSFKGGNFGIGTGNPAQNFVVSDDGRDGFEVFLQQPTGTVGLQAFNRTESAYKQMLLAASGFSFVQGNVGINTAAINNYKLAVNGAAIFTKAVVKNYNNWPDYVFDSSYQLPSLDSVSTFIQTNKHLPDMPSAAAVEKEGHDLGEVQKLLLKKMEEMTLYMIEMKKENEMLKSKIEVLTKKIENKQ